MNHPYLVDMSEWHYESEKAFNALLEYEINCQMKVDRPFELPSKTPKRGERMEDFACWHGTTVKKMKNSWKAVEECISRMPRQDYMNRFYEICSRLGGNKKEEAWIGL